VTVTGLGLKDAAEEKGPIPPWSPRPRNAHEGSRRDLCGGRGEILVPCTLQIAWRMNTFAEQRGRTVSLFRPFGEKARAVD
jgi:hypothetical protein